MRADLMRWLTVAVLAAASTAGAALAPRGLRRMDSFHVQQVEVTGARFLSPQEAVAATGISPTSTVFDDFSAWRESLLRDPLVLDVAVTRRLPFTVVLHVTETRPVAFVFTPESRPVDARGRVLEIDPTQVSLDLPLLMAPANGAVRGTLRDPGALRVLASLGHIAELEPAIFAATSEAAPLPDGVQLTLREPAGVQLLLPDSADAERLHLLRLTLADLAHARPDTAAPSGPPRLRRMDARYRDQIVVALTPNESR